MQGDLPVCDARSAPYGFTLLEIMLVLAIMAIAVVLVVPDFLSGSSASLDDESRRLQVALSLAAEDAQVYGVPVRWSATAHAYRFEKWDAAGKWDAVLQGPLKPHALPSGVGIAGVRQGQAAYPAAVMSPSDTAASTTNADGGEPALGQVLFWPDGSLTMADIELVRDVAGSQKPEDSRVLRLRPGPGGIRMAKASR